MYTHACTHTQSRFFSIRIFFSFALLLFFSCSLTLSLSLCCTVSLSLDIFYSLSLPFFLSRKRHVRLLSLDTHGKKSNLFPLEWQNTLTTLLLNLRENVCVWQGASVVVHMFVVIVCVCVCSSVCVCGGMRACGGESVWSDANGFPVYTGMRLQ